MLVCSLNKVFFFKCMYCALHKEGTAYKTALGFFDCFNAELHSFR